MQSDAFPRVPSGDSWKRASFSNPKSSRTAPAAVKEKVDTSVVEVDLHAPPVGAEAGAVIAFVGDAQASGLAEAEGEACRGAVEVLHGGVLQETGVGEARVEVGVA